MLFPPEGYRHSKFVQKCVVCLAVQKIGGGGGVGISVGVTRVNQLISSHQNYKYIP